MRLLGIDLGDKRTGVAMADTITRIASPVEVIEVPIDRRGGEDLLDAIVRVIARELGPSGSPGEVVVGLPLNMDDTEGPQAKKVRAFAERLGVACARTVHLRDERRTSIGADERMARSGLTHGQKKSRRDAIAAAEILRGYLGDRAE